MFTSQPHQRVLHRSRSFSPAPSPRHVVPRRNRSLEPKPVPVGAKRWYDEAFFDDDDDDWIFHPALDPYMEMSPSTGSSLDGNSSPPGGEIVGGAPPEPLLKFEMHPVRPRRKWRDVLHKQRYQARIQQHREANPTDDLGREVTESLRRTIHRQIEADSTLKPHHTSHFTMQSDAFIHAFQSTTFTVSEFEEGSDRLDTYLQALASRLNSNQAFEADDSFTVEARFIHTPGPGSGHGKRYKPSSAAVRGIVKRSRVTIKNRDELCCARAIVTMKTLVDANGNARDHHYHNLKQGRPVQERLAKELHRLAGVPEGHCGIFELQKFQAVLPDYQIKVMSIDPPHMLIFVGPTPSDKIIRIIKEDDHYDGCNSFLGFLSKSFFCNECNRGYDHNDHGNHPCKGKWCPSCHRKDCPDFAEAKRLLGPGKFPLPSSLCRLCHRSFFGEDCYSYHLHRRGKNILSICLTYRKCPDCFKTYEVENAGKSRSRPKQHKCGWGECPICEQQVHVASHQCYIQPIPEEEDEPKLKRVPRNQAGSRHVIEPDPEDPDTRVWVERGTPLQVYCDYEATVDDKGVQTPILLGAESDEEDHSEFFYGADCTESFFEWLESLAVDQDGDDRSVIAVFHNLKGYDGMFLLQHCYANHREVTDQITVGAKVLSFKSDRLTFKDSLCFLPFPLATFSSTFGIQELVKGFFPGKFNTQENQDCEGPMLNSFWGKFGENLHKTTTEAVTTLPHLFALVSDTFTDIHTVRICSQDSVEVVHSNLRENQRDNGRVNSFNAAFITCWARLKLYSYLEQLQQQVSYFDTDSVIFSWKPGQPNIPLGDFLGEMTDECMMEITSSISPQQDQRIMDTRPKTAKCAAKCEGSPSMFVVNNNSTTTSCARTFCRS